MRKEPNASHRHWSIQRRRYNPPSELKKLRIAKSFDEEIFKNHLLNNKFRQKAEP